MTKHQKQAHTKSTKRTCLQWRPLNEMLISGKTKPKKNLAWRPLDDVLKDGKILQQQLDAASILSASPTSTPPTSPTSSISPASPAPSEHSEHSATTLDEDLIYNPIILPSFNNNWYPTPFQSNTNHYYNNQLPIQTTLHNPQWLPSLCKDYPPVDHSNTPIFLNYQAYGLL